MKNKKLDLLAWKCLAAALVSATCIMSAALKPYQPHSTGLMLAALVLLIVSMYFAEKYEQVKYEQPAR